MNKTASSSLIRSGRHTSITVHAPDMTTPEDSMTILTLGCDKDSLGVSVILSPRERDELVRALRECCPETHTQPRDGDISTREVSNPTRDEDRPASLLDD